jgi:hypothetical protein
MFGEAEGRSRLAGSVETKPDRANREMVSREGIEPSTRRLRVVPDLPDHRRNRRIQAIDSADGGISRQIAATYAQRELSRGARDSKATTSSAEAFVHAPAAR